MEFRGFKAFISYFVLCLIVPTLGSTPEDFTIPTSYVVTYENLPFPVVTHEINRINSKVKIEVLVTKNVTAGEVIILSRPVDIIRPPEFNVTLNGELCYTRISTDGPPTLQIYLPKDFNVNETFTFEVDFRADPHDVLFPNHEYDNPVEAKNVHFAFGFDPHKIWKTFPCYRNHEQRVSIEVKVGKTPDGYTILMSAGTMLTTREDGNSSGWGPTPNVMPMNKFGLVAGKFLTSTSVDEETNLNYHFIQFHKDAVKFPDDNNQRSNKILVAMNLMLDSVIVYLNTSLAPNKVDLVVLPKNYAGAHNSWGLIYIHEDFLYTDSMASEYRMYLEIAKLIVHQYFGVLVVPEPGKFAWLTEGIGNFLAYKIVNEFEPHYDSLNQAYIDSFQHALHVDGEDDTVSMNENRSRDINEHKAGSLLRMLERQLGESEFQKALQRYFLLGQSRYTVPEDLCSEIDNVEYDNNDLIELVRVPLLWSSKRGFPLVTIEINDTHITFRQKRFSYNSQSTSTELWPVPFWIPIMNKTKWFDSEERTIERPNNFEVWMLAECAGNGFYRVNYPQKIWQVMTDKLKANDTRMSPEARARLINDAMHVSLATIVEHQTATHLIEFLENEKEYLPWAAAHKYILHLFQVVYQKNKIKLENYIKRLIAPLYDEFLLNDTGRGSLSAKRLHSIVIDLACLSGYKDPKTLALDAQTQTPKYNNYGFNIHETVGCNMVRALGSEVQELISEAINYTMSFDDRFKRRYLLRVLTCSRNATVLNEYLLKLFQDDTLIADRAYLPELFIENSNYDSIKVIIARLTDLLKNGQENNLNSDELRRDKDFERFVRLLEKCIKPHKRRKLNEAYGKLKEETFFPKKIPLVTPRAMSTSASTSKAAEVRAYNRYHHMLNDESCMHR